jgi:plastocyanin
LITESGFQPATLNAKAGDVIEFVNVDLVDHGVTGSTWNSGVLGAGQSYKVKVSANGTYVYSDVTDGSTQGTVVVGEGGSVGGQRLFLPLALK